MMFAGIPLWGFGLLVAGCGGVLAVLHLLRVRPREVRVITTVFWAQAMEPTRARTLWHRFQHPWTYALLLLICVLLSLALAQPEPSGEQLDRVHAVIVLDAGASMSAPVSDDDTTRFDAARAAAETEIGRLALDDRLAIVVANPHPRLIHGLDDARPLAADALAGTELASLPAARTSAVRLAASMLRGRSHPRVVLITDRPSEEEVLRDGEAEIDLRVVRVGAPVDNAAILSIVFEPDTAQPLRGSLRTRVGFWGAQPQDVQLKIERGGGAPLLSEVQTIAPGETHDFTIPDLPADGDELAIHLTTDDAVSVDNHAHLRLPLRTPVRVAFIGPVPTALRLAVEADPAVRTVMLHGDADVRVIAEPSPAEVEGPALVVVNSGPQLASGLSAVPVEQSALAEGLDFEGVVCGTGSALPAAVDGAVPLLMADDRLVAALSTPDGPGRLYLAEALLSADSQAVRQPAFAVLVSRSLRLLAGWDADPAVLGPERSLADPLWAQRAGHGGAVSVMPGSRHSSDLHSDPVTDERASVTPSSRWSAPAWFEIILYLGVACFLLEAALYTRGRIS
ncbi:MAG: VWA domain-containing protein [bacterium]|nr:VWA domain-containing protein [bacterium]